MGGLLLCFGFFFLQAADPVAEGAKAVAEGRYAEAAPLLEKAVAADPKDYFAQFNLAIAYSFLDRPEEAVERYRKVLELKPGLYEAELNLGLLLLSQNRLPDALPHLASAAEHKPVRFAAVYHYAEALYNSGQDAEAEEQFRRAVEADPKSAPAELGLGRALARQGKLDEADPHYRKAAELNPALKPALLELASLYRRNNRLEEALSLFRQLPEDERAKRAEADILLQTGKAAQAIPALEAALKVAPTAGARRELIEAYVRSGQPSKALPLLERAIRESPQDYELRLYYGRLLRDLRQLPEAGRQFLAAVELRPAALEAWNELTGVLFLLGQYPQALAALDRVRSEGGEQPVHVYLRAIVLDRLKSYDQALNAYQQFLSLANGRYPEEEFKARQRERILKRILSKR